MRGLLTSAQTVQNRENSPAARQRQEERESLLAMYALVLSVKVSQAQDKNLTFACSLQAQSGQARSDYTGPSGDCAYRSR